MNNRETQFDKIRLPLTIFLSFIIIFMWSIYQRQNSSKSVEDNRPANSESATNRSVTGTDITQATNVANNNLPATLKLGADKEATNLTTPIVNNGSRTPKAKLVLLESDMLKIGIDAVKGIVATAVLKDTYLNEDFEGNTLSGFETGRINFYDFIDRNNNLDFVVVDKTTNKLVLQSGFPNQKKALFLIHKEYELKEYELSLQVRLINKTNANLEGVYYLYNGASIGEPKADTKNNSSAFNTTRIAYTVDDKSKAVLKKGFFSSVSTGERETIAENVDWIVIDSRFYGRILQKRNSNSGSEFLYLQQDKNDYYIGAYKVAWQMPAGTVKTDLYRFMYLPKKRDLVSGFYQTEKEYFFNIFRQGNVMRMLSGWMYNILVFLNTGINNYGLSIVVMTFLLKLATFPLTHKSFKAMQKMQFLNPQIKGIRERYKNDLQKANVEIMALYKREKVNPMSGCLPMLIPIPIFIALYSLFQNMTELKGQSFLWISDLTLPDTLFTMSMSLPFLGNNFHLMPCIMMVTQIGHSLLTPQAPTMDSNAKQQMILMKYFMPIFFFFICWNMPSALVLFWSLQNLFSIVQTLLTHRNPKAISK